MSDSSSILVQVDRQTLDELRVWAREEHVSIADVICQAIFAHLAAEPGVRNLDKRQES